MVNRLYKFTDAYGHTYGPYQSLRAVTSEAESSEEEYNAIATLYIGQEYKFADENFGVMRVA